MKAQVFAAAALALVACASPRPKPLPLVSWPKEGAARARLVALLPDPKATAQRRSLLRRMWNLLIGVSPTRPEDQLVRPFAVVGANEGSLYVADPDSPGVFRISPTGALEPLACRDREWGAPIAVASRPDGSLLVADAGAAVIVRMAADRRCTAIGAGALQRPTGVVELAGRMYVADPPAHQVVVLGPDGAVLGHLGGLGTGKGQMHFPTAVAAAPDGTLLVVDALNFRVSRFSPGGEWIGSFGSPGEDRGQFARPKAVAADERGRVYVSDAQRDEILVFAPDGAFLYVIGESGTSPGSFSMPAGVAVVGNRLVVADSHNRRVELFELLGDAT